MEILFYLAATVAIVATAMVITRTNAVHALLYLIVSLLAVALVLYILGAPFIAALEIIIYAGAIMVLFVFVVMMLNLGPQTAEQESEWLSSTSWLGPALLAIILLGELFYMFVGKQPPAVPVERIEPGAVGMALFGPYLLAAELASMLLLAGMVGAYHLGQRLEP